MLMLQCNRFLGNHWVTQNYLYFVAMYTILQTILHINEFFFLIFLLSLGQSNKLPRKLKRTEINLDNL